MTVGSNPPLSSSVATIVVVVVLPCVPAMAMFDFSRISSASISARRTTGSLRRRASSSSGLPFLMRGRDHHHRRLADVLGPLPLEEHGPQPHQPVGDLRRLRVRPLHPVAQRHQHLGDARHADPADADEMDRPQFQRKFRRRVHAASLAARRFHHRDQPLGRIRLAPAPARCCAMRLGAARVAQDRGDVPRQRGGVKRAFPGSARLPRRQPARAHWPSGGRPSPPRRGSGSTAARSRVISATDDAPEREITSCASLSRRGMSAKNGCDLGRAPPPRHRPPRRASASSSRA